MKKWKLTIGALDDFLEEQEPFSEWYVAAEDEEHRELAELNHIYIPKLTLNIHVGVWESVCEDGFEADFDFYLFYHAETKEYLYSEQGSSLLTCIHNYTGLSWEEVEQIECEYREMKGEEIV